MNPKIKLCWSNREFKNFYSEKYAIIVKRDSISYVFFHECIVERVPGANKYTFLIKTEDFGNIVCVIDLNETYEEYNHDNMLILSDNAFKHKMNPISCALEDIANLHSLIRDDIFVEVELAGTQYCVFNLIKHILVPNKPIITTLIELNY